VQWPCSAARAGAFLARCLPSNSPLVSRGKPRARGGHGRRACTRVPVHLCTHDGTLTGERRPAGLRSTATCMSISCPVRPHAAPRGTLSVQARTACKWNGALTARERMCRLPDRRIRRLLGSGRYVQPRRRQASRARQVLLRRFCPILHAACTQRTTRNASLTLGPHTSGEMAADEFNRKYHPLPALLNLLAKYPITSEVLCIVRIVRIRRGLRGVKEMASPSSVCRVSRATVMTNHLHA